MNQVKTRITLTGSHKLLDNYVDLLQNYKRDLERLVRDVDEASELDIYKGMDDEILSIIDIQSDLKDLIEEAGKKLT